MTGARWDIDSTPEAGTSAYGRRTHTRPRLPAWLLPVVVAVFGLTVSLLVTYAAYHHERGRADTAFRIAAREHVTAITQTWRQQFASVREIADLFQVKQVVTRKDFSRLARSILARHPTIEALEWVPRITHLGREIFIARVRAEFPGFTIRDLSATGELVRAPRREEYYPILYVEPFTENRRALGFDPSDNEARSNAIRAAIDRAELSASASTSLVQDSGNEPAILVFVPVFQHNGNIHTRGTRGLAEGVFKVHALVTDALAVLRSQGLRITVSDVTGRDSRETLHTRTFEDDPPAWYQWSGGQHLAHVWSTGGRTYSAAVAATGARFAYDLRGPAVALGLSLGLTALATWLVGQMTRRERAVRELADQRATQLDHLSRHDALTGLLNRAGFQQEIELALSRVREEPTRQTSLCLVDLDQFKLINDVCGHEAGDALMRRLARRLSELIDTGDCVARLGGDEFGILLHRHGAEQAREAAARYLHTVETTRFSWGERLFPVTASAGIVEINAGTESTASAMSKADAACYIAKDHGRNRIHVFREDDHLSDRYRTEMTWVSAIREALDENRLSLYCQPILPCRQGGGKGESRRRRLELLLRMRDRDGEIIVPGTFLPAAERYGLMPSIDRWVVGNLIRTIRPHDRKDTLWFVNLSGQTLGDLTFCDFILHTLHHHDMAPESLCFEITETAVISNHATARTFIQRLRSVGCRFALDDFGSGMASFSYLKELEVDFLKIDGGFVRGMPNDRLDRAVTGAIQRLARELGISTIAEFVEDERIFREVRELGIDYAQGYLFGRPTPIERYLHRPRGPNLTIIHGHRPS
ncbi:putative bifunctional diguanylate cyclase/phosphodiesterase [Arhodomonas aquaeolei]|uniref:putative bifunctional diguanylate cyclase/phosphodiesterase n=1 Tax=Arhodomonas aquaeolei TaxID=2369 RepID=UPI00037DE040|nr:EAL domain-containing protein [Arhodomonas aquaeolei]